MKNKYIMIGELSKLTGVNAKSLRYYEKIGVLIPAFIDPENDYRYYAYSQIQLVYSIQFYVEMGIPLSELHRFINKKTGRINFKEQISYGIEIAQKKQQKIQQQIEHAKILCKEIDRADKVRFSMNGITSEIPQKSCAVNPIESSVSTSKFYHEMLQMLNDLNKASISIECEMGLLRIEENETVQNYIFISIQPQKDFSNCPFKIINFPAQTYNCKKANLEKENDELNLVAMLPEKHPHYAFFIESMASDFDYHFPDFELRWTLD